MPVYSKFSDALAEKLQEPFKTQVFDILKAMSAFHDTEDTPDNDAALVSLKEKLAALLGPYSKEQYDKLHAIHALQTIVEQDDECPWLDFLANLWEA